MATGDGLTYTYDGRGLRTVLTNSASEKRFFFYSPEMSLLAESELTTTVPPPICYEYVWFNGHAVGQIDGGAQWTFADHLGTPILQTDALANVFWRAEYEPYGKVFSLRTTDQHQPLRLPGQEAEQLNLGDNGATERFYNIFRWYRYGWGRYTQSDPEGLDAGINLYRYALANPLTVTDRFGLFAQVCCRPVLGTRSKHWFIRIDGHTYSLFPERFPCGGRGIPVPDDDSDLKHPPGNETCKECKPKPCPQIDGSHVQCFEYAHGTYPSSPLKKSDFWHE